MSADSIRKQTKQGFSGHVVLPQPVSDPSLIESVAGFIQEVVPQAYSSVLPGEAREQQIVWARFETADYNDPENYPQIAECESDTTPPLLLVLGYGTGAQVWSVPGGGDATEVLSWSLATVRTLRLLHSPKSDSDPFYNKRPLVAIVDSAGPGPQYCTVNFVSLRTGEVIKSIKFKTPIVDILCNKKSVVITFVEKIAVFDVVTLEDRLTITTCYSSPGICQNPVALGPRWLAYAEKRLTTWNRSSGGCEGDGAQSYTATAIHAVKTLGKGLRDLSGTLTGNVPPPTNNNASQPGIVTIMDIETKLSKEDETDNIVAHFVAHVGPIVAMSFDASGMLLVTADKHGHRFHVFRIQPHPVASQLAAVHHLYILHRGETTARVQDITISRDSRWVAVSSVRGTTHVFPITPYGGTVTVRTHTTPNVVNRLSRFERSAGLSDGRGSPLPEAPSQPLTPRLPPYPHPTTLCPLAQLRKNPLSEESPLAAVFAAPRAWIPGRTKSRRSIVESLFVISSAGVLLQYDLDPRCIPGIPKDKISYDTGIELGVEAKAEWCLIKPPYSRSMVPPLPLNNPLLLIHERGNSSESIPISDDRWLSQVEIITHTGPHRRLWMGPQFTFKPVDLLPTGTEEDLDKCTNQARSNPVNMPHSGHRPYLLIEGGSGGSIDSPHLTGYSSSTEDIVHGESRLREDLADAMLETSAPQSSGMMMGGGKMRAALLERQVNPLGTVITLPIHGSVPPPLQFILPAQAIHPSFDPTTPEAPPSTSSSRDYDYLNLALPCVPCVVNPPLESGSPPYVPAPLNEPELADPFLEVMKDAQIRPIFRTSSKIIKNEPTIQKEEIQQIKIDPFVVKPRDEIPSILPLCSDKDSDSGSEHGQSGNDFSMTMSNNPKSKSLSIKPWMSDPFEQTQFSEEREPSSTECAILQLDSEDKFVEYGETDSKLIPFETNWENSILIPKTYPTYELTNPLENCTETVEPSSCSDGDLLIDQTAEHSIVLDDQDNNEECPGGDSESNSEPITAVNISREASIIDLNQGDSVEASDCITVKNDNELCSLPVEEIDVIAQEISEVSDKNDKNDKRVTKEAKKIRGNKNKGKRKEIKLGKDIESMDVPQSIIDSGHDWGKSSNDQDLMSSLNPLFVETSIIDEASIGPKYDEIGPSQMLKSTGADEIEPIVEITKVSSTKVRLEAEPSTSTSNHETSSQSEADLSEMKHGRRERTKKLKSAESLEEIKKKSPSPSKAEVKLDTDSSDEAVDLNKQVKRKKGKKSEDVDVERPSTAVEITSVKLKSKSKSEGTLDAEKSDYETCSEKKSDSSIESFSETKKKSSGDPNGHRDVKSWSSIVKKGKDEQSVKNPSGNNCCGGAEDRDSVYESCNDEVAEGDSANFESSKEDFDESKTEPVKGESSSSNAEEKTDSGDKEAVVMAASSKKVRKQKKKRR